MKYKIETIMVFIFLLIFSFLTVYPILNILGVSLRHDNAFNTRSLSFIQFSEKYTDENQNGLWDLNEDFIDSNKNGVWDSGSSINSYITLFKNTDFLLWTRNSIFVSLIVTLTGVVFASTSGYALSRFKFKGREFGMTAILTTQMFPATMLLLPFFILLSYLGLINSYIGLIIIYSSTALPFCIWQMKGYYDTIPPSLEESARIDGCSRFQAFYKIILPLSTPALVITALFSFMASWSEYVVAAIILQDPKLYTLPLGLKSFQASLSTEWGLYAAGAVVVSIPVIILFISLSKYLVSGLTMGSVKG
ncbi:MAG: ABC transporter [Candidatus Marinimicrobia bacterium]|nr:ABC transporter [Candidatus Neomarinimicrobiota bacterium]|tara:strand:- start:553 stop:1470 length:918 start_codon:yes stop_codon:yes gene_type:complete